MTLRLCQNADALRLGHNLSILRRLLAGSRYSALGFGQTYRFKDDADCRYLSRRHYRRRDDRNGFHFHVGVEYGNRSHDGSDCHRRYVRGSSEFRLSDHYQRRKKLPVFVSC